MLGSNRSTKSTVNDTMEMLRSKQMNGLERVRVQLSNHLKIKLIEAMFSHRNSPSNFTQLKV